jgi:hypothetical protein
MIEAIRDAASRDCSGLSFGRSGIFGRGKVAFGDWVFPPGSGDKIDSVAQYHQGLDFIFATLLDLYTGRRSYDVVDDSV